MIAADVFWSHVDKSPGCWLWTGLLTDKGYGRCGKGGVRAHRVSFELANGPIPADARVLHRCDTPACVRPDHLFLGSQADNMRDMANKRRARGGCQQHIDANQARSLHAAGLSFSEIARRIGSTHTTVARAIRGEGRAYAHS